MSVDKRSISVINMLVDAKSTSEELKYFAVEDWSEVTRLPIIKKWILAGTKIYLIVGHRTGT